MFSVILLHALRDPFLNLSDKLNAEKYVAQPFYLIISLGKHAITIFFLISGFLVSYILIK